MKKNAIRLTEQDLNYIVENAVKSCLKESGMEEGVFGGLRNVGRAMRNGNFNVGKAYQYGSQASSFGRYARQAINALNQMINVANASNNRNVAQELATIIDSIEDASAQFNSIAQSATERQQQPSNMVTWNNRQ